MNRFTLFIVLTVAIFSNNLWAYGGGGSKSSKKACTEPKFSEFQPVHLAEAAPGSEISFNASALTNPSTIKVDVKSIPIDVDVEKLNNGYTIKGKLPASLQNTYARVTINAKGTNKCKGQGGWLLKIQ